MDFAGYWFGAAPAGGALNGNLYTIGFVEAHGLATIFAVHMILRRKDGWPAWQLAAVLCSYASRRVQSELLAALRRGKYRSGGDRRNRDAYRFRRRPILDYCRSESRPRVADNVTIKRVRNAPK